MSGLPETRLENRWWCADCESLFRKVHQRNEYGGWHSWKCRTALYPVTVTLELREVDA